MKKIKFYPKVFIVFFILLTVLGCIFVRGRQYYTITGDYVSDIWGDYVVAEQGYEVNGNSYAPSSDDPQVHLQFNHKYEDGVYGFIINFKDEIDISNVQVYFGRETQNYNESDSVKFTKKSDTMVEVVSLEPFRFARVDVNAEFEVSGFEVSKDIVYVDCSDYSEYVFMVLINIVFSAMLAIVKQVEYAFFRVKSRVVSLIKYIWKNKTKAIFYVLITVGIGVFAYIFENMYAQLKHQEYLSRYRFVIIFTVMYLVTVTFWFRKNIIKYLHVYFFIIVMLVGTVHVYVAPRTCGVSWDDEIHYGRTEFFSWSDTGKISVEAEKMIAAYRGFALTNIGYPREGRIHWENNFVKADDKNVLVETDSYKISLQYVAYIPGAVGLNLGRGIGLDYIDTFMLGKWMSLLCYAVVLSVSVKLLEKRGKLIVMALGLIPTSIFMATSYSYDWWVVSFTILGYALFFADIQRNKRITTCKMILIMAVMIIAMLPKAIYFPLIFPLLLLNKDKYENSKLSRGLAWAAMFILVISFILPMLTPAGQTGDLRGGSDVNSMEQIRFILSEPLEYTKILIEFLVDYTSPDNASGYMTYLAYYGYTGFYTICLMLILVATIFDNNEYIDKKADNMIVKGGALLAVFGSIVLASTALYVSFTPVRHYTILGCQPRYLLPVIFTLLYYAGGIRINVSEKHKGNVAMLVCIVMSFIFLYGVYDLCIAYY